MTRSRIRALALPLGLAIFAAVLVGIYVVSYRNSVTHGAGLVNVLVAERDIAAGTDGSTIAAGGYLTTQTVPRRAVVPGSITSAAPLTSLISSGVIYKGEQVTLRQFSPASQGGVFAQFSGNERVVVVPGDVNQELAGVITDGDHVDVVATTQYEYGISQSLKRSTTRVVLRNLLVLKAPTQTGKAVAMGGTAPMTSITLVMTDTEAQTMGFAMRNSKWFLVLRPTKNPRNSWPTAETLFSFLGRGLPGASSQIAGQFPEAVNEP